MVRVNASIDGCSWSFSRTFHVCLTYGSSRCCLRAESDESLQQKFMNPNAPSPAQRVSEMQPNSSVAWRTPQRAPDGTMHRARAATTTVVAPRHELKPPRALHHGVVALPMTQAPLPHFLSWRVSQVPAALHGHLRPTHRFQQLVIDPRLARAISIDAPAMIRGPFFLSLALKVAEHACGAGIVRSTEYRIKRPVADWSSGVETSKVPPSSTM